MLAQNFKSATELEIPGEHYDALVKTLVLMETGKLTFVKVDGFDEFFAPKPNAPLTFHFNMAHWTVGHRCGTVCCIGGTAEKVGNVDFYGDMNPPKALDNLFYVNEMPFELSKVTIEQATRALRNYLTHGEARWKEILENNDV